MPLPPPCHLQTYTELAASIRASLNGSSLSSTDGSDSMCSTSSSGSDSRSGSSSTPLPAAAPQSCVHLFPEGGMTNGSGMMTFSRGFMRLVSPGVPVVPVLLRLSTPGFSVRTHTLDSSFLANLFWFRWGGGVEGRWGGGEVVVVGSDARTRWTPRSWQTCLVQVEGQALKGARGGGQGGWGLMHELGQASVLWGGPLCS